MSPREKVKFEFVPFTLGHGLDVGHGPTKAFPHFLGVRRLDDPECVAANHFELGVADLARLDAVEDGKCDFIMAADATKMLGDTPLAIAVLDWLRCIRFGGHLCIYEPSDDAHMGFMAAINEAAKCYGLDVLRFSSWLGGGCYMVVQKLTNGGDRLKLSFDNPPYEGKTVCVVRHGGFGDQIQAAGLLPALKAQGFRVTVMTDAKGRSILEHDPHIDDWYMIQKDQVPNGELVWFWQVAAMRFDRFVNLNESVEGTFLAMPGRPQHAWPHALRVKMLDGNYAEFAADLAEVPFEPVVKLFYPSDDEVHEATRLKESMEEEVGNGKPLFHIMWALSGSSVHKWTPHLDAVIAKIMLQLKRAVVYLVGDHACVILEQGWEKEPRVLSMSGTLSIRQTLALAQRMDLVVGPETGVLNAVAHDEAVAKVIMLSHSSRNNLTKHWVNTAAVEGVAPCYPCHQLHYSSEHCPRDPDLGAAMCQKDTDPVSIYYPIDAAYVQWAKIQMLRGNA